MFKALKTNALVNHPAYGKIIMAYNEILKRDGKVNNKKFYEEVVKPEIPDYKMISWYKFLERFKIHSGIVAVEVPKDKELVAPGEVIPSNGITTEQVVQNTITTMQTNQAATASFIQSALNIGARRAQQILENPELMTAKEAMDFALKAMKAQDSRIHAIGKVREDNREEEKLNRAFAMEAYSQD